MQINSITHQSDFLRYMGVIEMMQIFYSFIINLIIGVYNNV